MDVNSSVAISVAVLVGVICLAVLLRKLGIIKADHGKLFAGLVTNVTLPALIFSSLARQPLQWSEGLLALIMLCGELLCLAIAWLLGRALNLERAQLGAFMLTAGFGSSSLLGYALITQVFPGNAAALAEAVLVSEVGVGPALFTVGVMISIYFGSAQVSARQRLITALGYFRSPIFFAIVAGLVCGNLSLPWDQPIMKALMQGLEILSHANTLLVTLTIGAALVFSGFDHVLGLAVLVCSVKLILKPVLLWLPTLGLDLPAWQEQVLVLEGAMPSALLSVTLCARYGCDAGLASRLVFATSVLSGGTIILMFKLLG